MTWMFELYFKQPCAPEQEQAAITAVAPYGGRLDFREISQANICLTFEFEKRSKAEAAHQSLFNRGLHVEGVGEYGS